MEVLIYIPEDKVPKNLGGCSVEISFCGGHVSQEIMVDRYDEEGLDFTELPKGHGRLSDMDELVKNIVKEYGVNSIHELPQDIKMFYDKFINSAPIVLDATFDYKLKNYSFFRKEEEK